MQNLYDAVHHQMYFRPETVQVGGYAHSMYKFCISTLVSSSMTSLHHAL